MAPKQTLDQTKFMQNHESFSHATVHVDSFEDDEKRSAINFTWFRSRQFQLAINLWLRAKLDILYRICSPLTRSCFRASVRYMFTARKISRIDRKLTINLSLSLSLSLSFSASNSSPVRRYPAQIYRVSSVETSLSDISHDARCAAEIAIWKFEHVYATLRAAKLIALVLNTSYMRTQAESARPLACGRAIAEQTACKNNESLPTGLPCNLLSARVAYLSSTPMQCMWLI